MEAKMFDIQTQLYEGKDIRFGPIDYEKDPEIAHDRYHASAAYVGGVSEEAIRKA
jgi:hypothetical protein